LSGNIFVSSVFSFVGDDDASASVPGFAKFETPKIPGEKNCEEHFKFSESSN